MMNMYDNLQDQLANLKSIFQRMCNPHSLVEQMGFSRKRGLPNLGNLLQRRVQLQNSQESLPKSVLPYCELTDLLSALLFNSGYSFEDTKYHTTFFQRTIIPALGSQLYTSLERPSHWKSFMNDDHTPIEFSLSWGPGSHHPVVRYGVEAVGNDAGTSSDPYNLRATDSLVSNVTNLFQGINLVWFNHFSDKILPSNESPVSADPHSSVFLAFDLRQKQVGLKAYFMPFQKACQDMTSPLTVIEHVLEDLPQINAQLPSSFDLLKQYLVFTGPSDRRPPKYEMISIDCCTPDKARVKIYVRSPKTLFDSVLEMMCFGGRLPPLPPKAVACLRLLWTSVLSYQENANDSDELTPSTHRTAGIIYHFDFRLTDQAPHCKLYMPMKHYGKDNRSIARAFGAFLEAQNKGLVKSSYEHLMESLCTYRRLEDGRGFHTYISADIHGEELAVTSYFQPELYHPNRFLSPDMC